MHTDILQQLGLPKNEAKIYEALTILGQSNVSRIASTAKVNRRNVYDSLKNLIKRGLVTKIHQEHENVYRAEHPKKLQILLDRQKQEIQDILPELNKIYHQNTLTEQAYISRGEEGIKNIWKYFLTQKQTVYFVGGKGAWHAPNIDEERKQWQEQYKHNNIPITGIFDYEMFEKGKDIYEAYDPERIRFFPQGYSTRASYDICGDRIILWPMHRDRSVENIPIFTFTNQSLADSYRTWFRCMWKKSLPLSQLL